jgi:xanthine dehydrogenase YagT iron-sulfur-binding subunit
VSNHTPSDTQPEMSRRHFLAAGATGVAAPLLAGALPAAAQAEEAPGARTVSTSLMINGQDYHLDVDARTTLLDALRDHLGLTGTKKGCDHGQCGACTILADGRRILSCLTLAVTADGRAITTIEGLARSDGELHPVQQAFVDNDAFQCGYCTPGQIMSAIACIHEGHAASDESIREYMSGNICRCAAYPNIVAAVKQAASETRKG